MQERRNCDRGYGGNRQSLGRNAAVRPALLGRRLETGDSGRCNVPFRRSWPSDLPLFGVTGRRHPASASASATRKGAGYVKGLEKQKAQHRVPVVFDNLIHKKEMPVTVGIFLNPGSFPNANPKGPARTNRPFEYDTLSDQYAKFLDKEILPEVGKTVKLRTDAAGRAICGISSGGICAFTAAWERPDLFSKVLSHVGSFTNIRGGDVYPGLIRKTEKKPLRVFLQDGTGDLDNMHGNWPLANLSMAASLRFIEYDYKLVFGDGGHGGKHGGVILPDSLRWLWRDTPAAM